MMNPQQYMPPGQNNNAPSNPLGYPPSHDFNGAQNMNSFNQVPTNGPQMPPKPVDQTDMSQKLQNMSINGPAPQGYSIPSSELPPGQFPSGHIPPPSNFGPGQLPPGQRPANMPPRPSSGESNQRPQQPPSSTSGMIQTTTSHQFPPPSQMPNLEKQFQQGSQRPPSAQLQQGPSPMAQSTGPQGPQMQQLQKGLQGQGQIPPQMGPGPQDHGQIPPQMGQGPIVPQGQMLPPMNQLSQGSAPQGLNPINPQVGQGPRQMPPHSSQQPSGPPVQGQMPPHLVQAQMPPSIGQQPPGPGRPMQGQFPKAGVPPPIGPQGPFGQHGQAPTSHPGQMPQHGLPPKLHPGQMPQQGLPPSSHPGQMPPQGLPPNPGQMPQQVLPPTSYPGQMPQQGFIPTSHSGQTPQPGLPPRQPGLPPQPGAPQMRAGPIGQPGYPGQLGTSSQGGLPPQPSSGLPPNQGLPPHTGIPPQPGFPQPGQLPQQPGLPPQPGFPGQQYQGMPGMPHMPPPVGQRQFPQPGPPGTQPGYGAQPPNAQYAGMPQQQGQVQPGYQQPSSGYPPQYQAPFPGQQPSHPNQQFPQQKRLDPDQMPSPIQVMADDQQNRGGVFVTNEKGLVPPLVTTDFTVDDKGNASPRYIRSSMYTVPATADLLKQTSIPFCLVISPMAETVGPELEPPLLDVAALTGSPGAGPVRCSRCKAYMCPNMKFLDAGRHFKCSFCKATTEVPMEYTQYINSMQQYGRVPAEMALGAYEIVATKEYCRNNTLPNPPAIVFVIDVSYNAIKMGLVQTVCDNVMNIIDAMPKDEVTGKTWTRVGFITYSSTVHFYNIKGSLAQPQMLSVGEVGDMFVPLLEGFLVTAEESGLVLQQLLSQLPTLFQETRETQIVLLPAVQAGLEALKAAETSGQLMVFHTTLPTYDAPGKLNNREDRKLLGTDKEKQILGPQTTAYNEVGQLCALAGVSVELFVCNNAYFDAATVGQLPRLTGGALHKYTYFTAEADGARLVWDARRVAARPTAHDAVMRVRCSTGVRATDFYGHFYMSNTTDVELAALDSDKAIGIEIKHDDKLTGEDGVYIQAALLYTHRSGQRRLRVLNLALNVSQQLADVYRSMEQDTCINFLTKQAVWALREHPPRQVRETLSQRCARSLAAYRRHCASPSSAGQLVLPEAMKLLPLYTSCVLRSDAVGGGPDLTCDDRSCAMYRALTADVTSSVVYTYPRLLPLRAPRRQLRASIDKMADHGAYLLENGVHMLLWVGSQTPSEWVSDVFGVPSPQQIDAQVCELPDFPTEASRELRELVQEIREQRRAAMRLTVMRQHDKLEAVLRHFLVEDRGADGSASYVDFLCHVHKEIRALL